MVIVFRQHISQDDGRQRTDLLGYQYYRSSSGGVGSRLALSLPFLLHTQRLQRCMILFVYRQRGRCGGATLTIARLDRLSRNAAFLLTLRDSGVGFVACDMPEANDLTVGMMAPLGEKIRGMKLGNANITAALR